MVTKHNLEHEVKKQTKKSTCEVCSARFNSEDELTKHIATVHERKKPYSCTICNKRFSQKAHLDTHIACVHEEQKPYKCTGSKI